MINALQLKKIATYNDAGVDFSELKKINFIYGSNGSGKTTLTKFLHTPGHGDYADCKLVWASNQPLKTEVYNKEFRDRNFSAADIDGVFTLGQATKEEQDNIDLLKEKQKKTISEAKVKQETADKMNTQLSTFEEQFRDEVWTGIYKKHESYFKEGFRGFINNKEAFKVKFLEEVSKNTSKLMTLDKLKAHALTILGEKPVKLEIIAAFSPSRIDELENEGLWSKKIIGKTDVNIARLIQRLNINDWVNQGRSFIQKDKTCPFCQEETISEGFRKDLEEYFDETFVQETGKVKQLAGDYALITENLIHQLGGIEDNEKSLKGSKLQRDLFSAYLKTLEALFVQNLDQIAIKLKEPSRAVELKSTSDQLAQILVLIAEANIEIVKHNKIVDNFEQSKKELIGCIWKFATEDFKTVTENYLKNKDALVKGITGLEVKISALRLAYKELRAEIVEASKNLTSVQPSVDQINLTLQSYGFNNFKIVPAANSNKYQIQRQDGELVGNTLSEGEVTFVTFLYFLQLAKGSVNDEDISLERILVIDDPISSLDSSILFVISSLIRGQMAEIRAGRGNIRQLILLTHNVYFHKEASFISSAIKECKDTHYWILRKQSAHTSLQPFGMKNPIQSSYELLWQEIKNRAQCSSISIQNTMRRILENYFKILGGISEKNIIDLFETLEEREICKSLMLWINDGSHSIPDDIFIERQEDIIEKYYQVFKKIFFIASHDQHFKMMMGEKLENGIVS